MSPGDQPRVDSEDRLREAYDLIVEAIAFGREGHFASDEWDRSAAVWIRTMALGCTDKQSIASDSGGAS